jgi:hypothetical protein
VFEWFQWLTKFSWIQKLIIQVMSSYPAVIAELSHSTDDTVQEEVLGIERQIITDKLSKQEYDFDWLQHLPQRNRILSQIQFPKEIIF